MQNIKKLVYSHVQNACPFVFDINFFFIYYVNIVPFFTKKREFNYLYIKERANKN